MKKILVTRRLLRSNEDRIKELYDANLNLNDEILASDYSYGQVYFEVSGENKNTFLNKLTQFKFKSMLDYQNKNFYLSFLKFSNK